MSVSRAKGAKPGPAPRSISDRFWPKVDKRGPDECWEWLGGRISNGYGLFMLTKRPRQRSQVAHRTAYELLVGPIPDGLQLDHLCRNRVCVNPAHLEPVTCRENLLRGDTAAARNLARTHCRRGHPLHTQPNGRRRCRTCENEANRVRQ